MKTWACERCHGEKEIPSWINNASIDTCARCGTPHTVSRKWPATAIPPELETIEHRSTLRMSPWHQAKYRPYKTGNYECQFADGTVVYLEWDGNHWMWGAARIAKEPPMAKWRGCWHPTEIGRTE